MFYIINPRQTTYASILFAADNLHDRVLDLSAETELSFQANVSKVLSFDLDLQTKIAFTARHRAPTLELSLSSEVSFTLVRNITGTMQTSLDTLLALAATNSFVGNETGDLSNDTIEVVCVNARTFGCSTYSNYAFNSFFELDGQYYGCCTDGVFLLSGDKDLVVGDEDVLQNIDMVVKSGVSSYSSAQKKAIGDVYVYCRSTDDVIVELVADEQKEITGYTAAHDGFNGLRQRRVKTSRGVRGNNWQLTIRNSNGADLVVQEVTASVSELSRKI